MCESENQMNNDEQQTYSFGGAIRLLKDGDRVARKGWNGKGMWLKLQMPDEHSKMTLPYIYMFTADGNNVPWLASQTDMLAHDWVCVEEAPPPCPTNETLSCGTCNEAEAEAPTSEITE